MLIEVVTQEVCAVHVDHLKSYAQLDIVWLYKSQYKLTFCSVSTVTARLD
jgi:hypothetical protein